MDITRREFTLASFATAIGLSLPTAATESLEHIVQFGSTSHDLREVVAGLMRFHNLMHDPSMLEYRAVATLPVWPGSRGKYVREKAFIAFMIAEDAPSELYDAATQQAIDGMLRFM